MPSTIETPRLRLRPFRPEDLPTFAAYRSDAETARYQSWQAPYTLAQAERFLESMAGIEPGTPGEWFQFALERKSDGAMIGDCAFCILADDTDEDTLQAEIGYTLAPAARGRGYATEAVRGLLDHLFAAYGLHRVRANCDPENRASARVLERVGMRCEGHFIESLWFKGDWADELWYAILRREWQQQCDMIDA